MGMGGMSWGMGIRGPIASHSRYVTQGPYCKPCSQPKKEAKEEEEDDCKIISSEINGKD